MEKNKQKQVMSGSSTWTLEPNPLYYVECPHCKSTIFMSAPSTIEKLKRWAVKFLSK